MNESKSVEAKDEIVTKQDIIFNIKNIKKTFWNGTVLQFSDEMRIKRGSMTFIVGDSGVGKSTLVNMLGLMDKADNNDNKQALLDYYPDGETSIDYFDLYKRNWKYYLLYDSCAVQRSKFGFLPQNGHLLHTHTVWENLEIVVNVRNNGKLGKSEKEETILSILKRVGFDFNENDVECISKKFKFSPAYLSGGQAQRLALARAILYEPAVIFVDEPTTFMDYELQVKTMDVLSDLVTKNKCTIILITHEYEKLKRILPNNGECTQTDSFFLSRNNNVITWEPE